MRRISPAMRIAFGLVMLVVSVLLGADLVGLTPDRDRELVDARRKLSETLAIQFSYAASVGDRNAISYTIEALVDRNDDVLSAGLRRADGTLVMSAGEHEHNWGEIPFDKSTVTQVQVPIYEGKQRWGGVEIRFAELRQGNLLQQLEGTPLGLILYTGFACFGLFIVFIKRTLRELNPSSVIPERVKAAFDVLTEGVLILDERENIVLANSALARTLGAESDKLMGQKATRLPWKQAVGSDSPETLPWHGAMASGERVTGVALSAKDDEGTVRTFVVNAAPILDSEGKPRGVLATFDDMTALEHKNNELHATLSKLRKSQQEISEKNKELEFLATRDPLTGCLNRRAFFTRFEPLFDIARKNGGHLCCIMTDIDHFKSVNDRYGHATGDKVIQLVADVLRQHSRPDDLVCRYGGEEFCVAMPGLTLEQAAAVAERLRIAVHAGDSIKFTAAVRVSASFGVASSAHGADSPAELINQADKALYAAKESGRNRVIQWSDQMPEEPAPTAKPAAEQAPEAGIVELGTLRSRVKTLERNLKHRTRQLRQRLFRDDVTGLPNRDLFLDRVRQAISRTSRFDRAVAVLSVNIDMLQRINNTLGHVAGNELLKAATARLSEILRDTDTLALMTEDGAAPTVSRLSTDELGILLTDLRDSDAVTWIVKRLFDSVAGPIQVSGHEIFLTGNIGISLHPHDASDAEALVSNASAARSHAKERLGRNSYEFFSAEINEQSLRSMELEGMLHHALEGGQLELYYQPKVDLRAGRITSLEALIRWAHPERGLITPDQFIPIAEHTGLINEIGAWVVRTAAEHLRGWLDQGLTQAAVAVNLSAVQFRQPGLAQAIITTLDDHGIEASRFEVEITESALMENLSAAESTMARLREHGVSIAVDDFGTGYSSLSYLKRFPVDTVKIDRSFLTDLPREDRDAAMVRGIVAMAHAMNLQVLAEGVETAEQLAVLRELGCDHIQGYLFSRPVRHEDATRLLVEGFQAVEPKVA